MEPDRQADIAALDVTLTTVERVLDVDGLRARIGTLEQQASDPNLWDDQANAQRVTSELSQAQGELRRAEGLRGRLADLPVLYELAAEEAGDAAVDALAEADAELAALHADIEAMEVRTLLSGEYDEREALVTIRSGAGGVDAADWAEMLMRMYIRWAEQHKYPVEVFDTSYAEEAGIKSATFTVEGDYAYGLLKAESGVHRLVRVSPFDANGRRQTSFAAVQVTADIDDDIEIDIKDVDLRIDTYRAGGAGGQHVNKTDSAVRITHLPTGIVVQCQNERSQHANKDKAFKLLRARMYDYEIAKREAKAAEDAKARLKIEWGSQIRSYVLFPYQQVNDHRTEVKTSDVTGVLDGDLDDLIRTYLLKAADAQKN
ncbi:MAG TPA: peptide chain release factor 2 [Mycobacterium sp.]|nr:peptide chain release factor 2 [Mycobacterium sp.]